MKITKIQNSHENSSCKCPGDVPSFPWHCCGYLPSTVEDPNALDPRTITTSSLRCAAATAQMSFLEFSQATSQTPKSSPFFFNKFLLHLTWNQLKEILFFLIHFFGTHQNFRPLCSFLPGLASTAFSGHFQLYLCLAFLVIAPGHQIS